MAFNRNRREFLTKELLPGLAGLLNGCASQEKVLERNQKDYFDSFETCYPLLTEAGDMLIEEAVKRGIKVEGKSREEIARAIFSHIEKA